MENLSFHSQLNTQVHERGDLNLTVTKWRSRTYTNRTNILTINLEFEFIPGELGHRTIYESM